MTYSSRTNVTYGGASALSASPAKSDPSVQESIVPDFKSTHGVNIPSNMQYVEIKTWEVSYSLREGRSSNSIIKIVYLVTKKRQEVRLCN